MRRSAARSKASSQPVVTRDLGRHDLGTASYQPLRAGDVDRIVDAALILLAEGGVVIEPGTEADQLFAAAGCEVSGDGIVKIPPAVVRAALATVAKSVKLWDRHGEKSITIDAQHTRFFPGMTCIKVYDRMTGEPRESDAADLAEIVRVADALEHIDGVCVACKDVPHSDIHGEVNEFAILARNTTKPLEYLCEHAESLATVIEMAAAIRGGRAQLREKPYFLQIVTPLPLNYPAPHLNQIIQAVRAGVPVSTGTLPIGGASSPITMAGAMAHSLATDFAGMVLAQLVEPGSFCIGSSDVCFMEPATGGIGSFAHTSLADMAMCQIRRSLDLPSFTGIGGCSVARRFNQDAVWEISSNMMQAFYSRPATCDYLGSLDQGMTYSLHALLLCNDIAGLLRHLWSGITVDDEQLALHLAREVGPRGNYLAQRHTANFARSQAWSSRYFGANIPLSTSIEPDKDLIERIDDDLKEIVNTHQPAALPEHLSAELVAIQARFKASYREQ
jgi:trimethylamine:corrinoid methyltransferase-like protein